MNTYEFCADWVAHQPLHTRVLDYGCGAGQIVALLRERGVEAFGCDVFYEGGDYSSTVVPYAAQFIHRMHDDVIPFDDASFDIVLSNQVLEHVPKLDTVVAEMARVLKPNGVALNVFPDRSVWREGHYGVPFQHRFSKRSRIRVFYTALARALGFGILKEGKPFLAWCRESGDWLDKWTYYRPIGEIHRVFAKHFERTSHAEELWFDARLGKSPMPRWIKRLIVRKLAGMTLVSVKAAAPVYATRRPPTRSTSAGSSGCSAV